MKRITTTFDIPEDLDIAWVREYVENALHSEGGNYTPEHPYFQLCRILRLTEITTSEGVAPKPNTRPILGQRCIVRDRRPYIGIVVAVIDGAAGNISIRVRHAITKVEQNLAPSSLELLPP